MLWTIAKIIGGIAGGFFALLAIAVAVYAVRQFRHAMRDDER
jgi:hypothetical protein